MEMSEKLTLRLKDEVDAEPHMAPGGHHVAVAGDNSAGVEVDRTHVAAAIADGADNPGPMTRVIPAEGSDIGRGNAPVSY